MAEWRLRPVLPNQVVDQIIKARTDTWDKKHDFATLQYVLKQEQHPQQSPTIPKDRDNESRLQSNLSF